MKCQFCGVEFPDVSIVCSSCGASLKNEQAAQAPEPAEHLENGITIYDGSWAWEGECPAKDYRAIFTLSAWIIGLAGGIVTLFLLIFTEISTGMIAGAVTCGVYLVIAGCLLLIRGGRFHGHFSLDDDAVRLHEEMHPPEKPLLLALYIIYVIVTLLLGIALIASGNGAAAVMPDSGSLLRRTCKYKRIKNVTVSPDQRTILLKRTLGTMKLLVTPEQCSMIATEINRRRAQTEVPNAQ